jgi:hypothetical protein
MVEGDGMSDCAERRSIPSLVSSQLEKNPASVLMKTDRRCRRLWQRSLKRVRAYCRTLRTR